MLNPPGLFITGTDTDVGKTYVAALVARALVQTGVRLGVYKPVASGCRPVSGDCVSDDALTLWQAADKPGELAAVCPQRFIAPLAPYLAARAEGREVDNVRLRMGLDYWRERSEMIVVEGAGGFLSPLSQDLLVADLAWEFGYPLVIVAQNRIGAINQTLLAIQAAQAYRGGLKIAGVVLNETSDPAADFDPSRDSNFTELTRWCTVPVLRLRWQSNRCEPEFDWRTWCGGNLRPS